MPRDLQTSPEPQTLRAPDDLARRFLAFCRSKPAGEEYDFGSMEACALGRFGDEWYSRSGGMNGAPDALHALHRGTSLEALIGQPRTYSALSDRLEALSLPERL